jgi:hypothetical protein
MDHELERAIATEAEFLDEGAINVFIVCAFQQLFTPVMVERVFASKEPNMLRRTSFVSAARMAYALHLLVVAFGQITSKQLESVGHLRIKLCIAEVLAAVFVVFFPTIHVDHLEHCLEHTTIICPGPFTIKADIRPLLKEHFSPVCHNVHEKGTVIQGEPILRENERPIVRCCDEVVQRGTRLHDVSIKIMPKEDFRFRLSKRCLQRFQLAVAQVTLPTKRAVLVTIDLLSTFFHALEGKEVS